MCSFFLPYYRYYFITNTFTHPFQKRAGYASLSHKEHPLSFHCRTFEKCPIQPQGRSKASAKVCIFRGTFKFFGFFRLILFLQKCPSSAVSSGFFFHLIHLQLLPDSGHSPPAGAPILHAAAVYNQSVLQPRISVRISGFSPLSALS